MKRIEQLYYSAKSDRWMKGFSVFCRIALAASFLPAGIVKIMGQRFAEGLPPNNPLGHYFDALFQTGYYYTFIGVVQLAIVILLLFPKTSLLGALMYFPIIVNITVLAYATRFDGTRLVTMLLLANLFLLAWNYNRLRYLLSYTKINDQPPPHPPGLTKRQRLIFFSSCVSILAILIIGTFYLYEITPGNSEEECRNQCASSKNPAACKVFCDCIYQQGKSLDSCLAAYNKAKK